MSAFDTPKMIDTNGVTLEVFEQGSKSVGGKPIVMCHGFPEHAFSWRHQVPVLADAGYHVIVPNQRGYGNSSQPEAVEDYDIAHLTGDMAGLLDHYGYDDAVFVGHDWGAIMVWGMAMLHPDRVAGAANLSVPFMNRGEEEWIGLWEKLLGPDMYIVHFNRQPGVADAALAENSEQFIRNLYRTKRWLEEPMELEPGNPMISLAKAVFEPQTGEPMMSEEELQVYIKAFAKSGYTGGINWYRNFTRNWDLLADVPEVINQPALMLYGQYDIVPESPTLKDNVPHVEVHTLPCGHWIQQEEPEETNRLLLDWLGRHYPS